MKHAACLVAAGAALLCAAASSDVATEIHQEIALLTFIGGGSPLSQAEQRKAEAIVRQGEASAPDAWTKVIQNSALLLRKLDGRMDPRIKARLRAAIRLNVAAGPRPGDPLADEFREEAAIIAAHDPVVVWDAAHKRLITLASVAAMVEADRSAALLFGVPEPGRESATRLAETLRRTYPDMDDGMQTLLAQAETNLPFALAYLQQTPPATRSRFIASMSQKIQAGPNADDRLLRLTQVLSGLGARGAAQSGGGGAAAGGTGSQLREQQLMQNQMLGASRSFSPQCNTYTGANQANVGYCHP